MSSLIVRVEELASQAANGTLAAEQRRALDAEAQALSAEYTRIVETTDLTGRMY